MFEKIRPQERPTENRSDTNGVLDKILAMLMLLLASCGIAAATEATTELSVAGTDTPAFEPAEFAVPAGEEVTLRFTAEEAVDHDFIVEGAGSHVMAEYEGHGDEDHPIASGDLAVAHAEPGQTVTGRFMIEEPGTYRVYCSVPGHRDAGMVATLTVLTAPDGEQPKWSSCAAHGSLVG